MKKKRITDTGIKNAKPGTKPRSMWDTETHGFFVEIKPNGKKVFKAKVLRGPRRNRQKSLGRVGEMTLEDARKAALAFLDDTPAAERSDARLSDIYERYMVQCMQKHNIDADAKYKDWPKTINEHRLSLAKLIRDLKDPLFADFNKQMLQEWHEEHDAPYAANRTLAYLKAMLKPLIEEGLPDPTKGIKRHPEKARNLALSTHEVSVLMTALDNGGNETAAACIKLMVKTGQRPSEIRELRWTPGATGNYVDPEDRKLVMREHKTSKWFATDETRVGFGPKTAAFLESLPRNGRYVFPSERDPEQPISYETLKKALYKAREECANLDPDIDMSRINRATLYTLRHSFATQAATAGWTISDIGKHLKHKSYQTTLKYIKMSEEHSKRLGEQADELFGDQTKYIR